MKNQFMISKIKTIIIVTTCFFSLNSCSKKECEYNIDKTFPFACDGGMDVAFVVDYTGSMGPAINGIKSSVASIVSTIVAESGGDYRLSLSFFDERFRGSLPAYSVNPDYISLPAANKKTITSGASHDQFLTMVEKFSTNNSATFSTQLAKLNGSIVLGSGSGAPEPGGLIMNEIVNNAFAGAWRPGKTKIMIIITDAQDGGDDDNDTVLDDTYLANLAAQANAANIQCVLVSTLSSSNYQVHLIGNNTAGVAVVKPNFTTIAADINEIITDLCE